MQFALPRKTMLKILMEQGRTEAEAKAQMAKDDLAVKLSSKIFAQKLAAQGLARKDGCYRIRFDDDNDPVFKAMVDASVEADAIVNADDIESMFAPSAPQEA